MLLLIILLFAAIVCLLVKIQMIYHSVKEIRIQFAERMKADTNIGIDITYTDKQINQLAAGLDRQLKLLRQKEIRYTRGHL